MNKLILTQSALSVLAMCLAATPTFAQDKPAASASGGLEDIVVTARKRAENLQDVPVSVAALTGEQLQARGINSLSELAQYTPGLQYSQDFGRTGERPVIRGISALRTEAPQPVSIFVDGAYVKDGALSLLLDDAERVEVIKGPQSALYGRATYQGAINYISRAPTDDFSGQVRLTGASHQQFEAFATISGALVPGVLRAKISAKHYEYGGEYTNTQTNNKIGNERTNALAATIDYTPTDAIKIRLQGNYAHDRDGLFAATARTVPTISTSPPPTRITATNNTTNIVNGGTCNGRTLNIVGNNTTVGSPLFGLPDPAVPATATNALNGWPCGAVSAPADGFVRRNETDLGDRAGLSRKTARGVLTIDWDVFDDYRVTSQTAYTDVKSNVGADQSYNGTRFAPAFVGGTSWLSYDEDKLSYISQEIRLTSPADKAFRYIVGAFFYDETTSGMTSGVLVNNPANPAAPLPDPLRNKATPESRNLAGFAQAEYRFGDKLRLSGEVRYSEERIKISAITSGVAVAAEGGFAIGEAVCFRLPGSTSCGAQSKFKQWSPRATVDFKPTENIMIYAQAARGTKAGGFNTTPGLSAAQIVYRGENVWSYEAGVKSDFLDNRLRLNVAAFWNDISDLQLSNIAEYRSPLRAVAGSNPPVGQSTTVTVVNNVGKARTRGFEIEAMLKATDQITLSANYAFTDAKSIEGTEATNGTVYGGNRSVAGFELPRSPRHSAAGSAELRLPIADDRAELTARADVTYQSRRYAEIQNLIWADSIVRINMSIGIETDKVSLQFWAKNLNNNDASLNGFRYLDPGTFRRTAVDFLPRLRQIGTTFSYKF
jgi:iron complex outermembrane recepter protein